MIQQDSEGTGVSPSRAGRDIIIGGFMPMLRHLLTCAAITTMAFPGAPRAGEFANPYEGVPRCPDDPGAGAALPLHRILAPEDAFEGAVGPDSTQDREGNIEAPNGVTVRQGDRQLTAQQFNFNEAERRIDVRGKVQYSDPQIILRGDAGSFVPGEATVEGANFELPMQPARGSARSLTLSNTGVLQLKDVHYTTCPEGSTDWQLSADSISIDTNRSVGTARDARVEFFGVPILRLPYISFPVGSARKSGLLFPSLGSSSTSGVQLAVPYYFNIAPAQDLTLTPTYYTSRGLDVGGEYRFLTRSSRGEISGNLLPDDRKTGHTRSRLKVGDTTMLPRGWRLTLDAENVSDARYFEDFAQGADGASIAFLPRRLQLSYRDDNLDTGIILRNFQTLDQDLPQTDRPHTEVPRLYARGNWLLPDALPLNYGFDTEAVFFPARQ